MSYSDDVLLTVAKEIYFTKILPMEKTRIISQKEYSDQFGKVAEEFCSFVNLLRQKLSDGAQS